MTQAPEWKPVPVEPTAAMLEAGFANVNYGVTTEGDMERAWSSMLAAAPRPPEAVPAPMSEERELFEAAFRERFPASAKTNPVLFAMREGDYCISDVGIGWWMWQAARAQLAVPPIPAQRAELAEECKRLMRAALEATDDCEDEWLINHAAKLLLAQVDERIDRLAASSEPIPDGLIYAAVSQAAASPEMNAAVDAAIERAVASSDPARSTKAPAGLSMEQERFRHNLETFATFDEVGLLEPKPPFTWETLARCAIDLAVSALATPPAASTSAQGEAEPDFEALWRETLREIPLYGPVPDFATKFGRAILAATQAPAVPCATCRLPEQCQDEGRCIVPRAVSATDARAEPSLTIKNSEWKSLSQEAQAKITRIASKFDRQQAIDQAAAAQAVRSKPLLTPSAPDAREEFENGVNAWLDNQHPDDAAVDAFAGKMRRKMAASRERGRGGWNDKVQCSAADLSAMLREHVEKGDPIDVANFAMMLGQRGERIEAAEPAVPARVQALDDEACDKAAAQAMDRVAAAKGLEHAMHLNPDVSTNHTLRRELIRAGCALAAPAVAAAPVADKLTPSQIERIVAESGADVEAMTPKDWKGMRRVVRSVEAALAGNTPAGGEAIETVPWPKIVGYAGGADAAGVAGWLDVCLTDGPVPTRYIPALSGEFEVEQAAHEERMRYKGQLAKIIGESLSIRTQDLVWRFTIALGKKLAEAEKKYGYTDGWESPDWLDECREKLVEHVAKGDPRDVAAYCAFLWHHGASTAALAATPSTAAAPRADEARNAALEEAAKLCESAIDDEAGRLDERNVQCRRNAKAIRAAMSRAAGQEPQQ